MSLIINPQFKIMLNIMEGSIMYTNITKEANYKQDDVFTCKRIFVVFYFSNGCYNKIINIFTNYMVKLTMML